MKTTFAAVLTTTILLGGCAEQRQREAVGAQQNAITDAGHRLNAARLACYAQFPDSNAQRADCKTNAEDAIMGV
jgi:outer membrane murein-binding lipoprotein Lpp